MLPVWGCGWAREAWTGLGAGEHWAPSQVAEHAWWQRVAWSGGRQSRAGGSSLGTEDPLGLWWGEMGTGQGDSAPRKAVLPGSPLSPSSSLCCRGRSLGGRRVFGSLSHRLVPAEPSWLVPKQGRQQRLPGDLCCASLAAATPLFSVRGRGTTNDIKSKCTQKKRKRRQFGGLR